jgi:acetylornithine deacetylase/succinyl-diaminopimelate desuccinylase-like protein
MNTQIDWKSSADETVNHLSHLIQAETVNPPGNELPAIQVIREVLEREGLGERDFKIVESAPG